MKSCVFRKLSQLFFNFGPFIKISILSCIEIDLELHQLESVSVYCMFLSIYQLYFFDLLGFPYPIEKTLGIKIT